MAELVEQLIKKELIEMEKIKIKHAPTIGAMYEGLSQNFLSSSIPKELDIRVVSGFIRNSLGTLSGQIDVMVATGEGQKLPNTDLYIYDIGNVLAVFEIKKDMSFSDLTDAFSHLAVVWDMFYQEIRQGSASNKPIGVDKVERDYATIFGEISSGFSNRDSMSDGELLIYNALVYERMQPLKIILSYNGYKTEKGMRDALYRFLSSYQARQKKGYGITSYPNLIISNNVSIVKCNGNPYTPISTDGYWDFLASTTFNPLVILLEVLWTKISNEFDVYMPWGEDLKIERLNMFLKAKPKRKKGETAWEIRYYNIIDESEVVEYDWEPVEINEVESTLLLGLGSQGRIDLKDSDLIEFCKNKGYPSPIEALKRLIDGRIVALTKDKRFAGYVTEECAIVMTPSGMYAADNAQPRYRK
ncbi:DUF6602 domain-containing protein [Deinococcus aerius]|nr:DUF6602 domain-containing protein [Deinococcus aerius]